jgi:restriction system protein
MGRNRWQARSPKVVGALHGKRAKKGVFITTGKFSDDARKYVDTMTLKWFLLMDGSLLN